MFEEKIQLVERIGIEPIQSYLYAGDLQSLELTNAQPFQTHFIQMCIIKQTICYALRYTV